MTSLLGKLVHQVNIFLSSFHHPSLTLQYDLPCASYSLQSMGASKITFVVWFRLFTLPEMQFQPYISIPIVKIETVKNTLFPFII